ncbi:type I restriction-modification system endonuclease [Pseudomonas sp. 5P_3.1_Bac2]|uniref:type I restriction-modification system endonuclease n=1 Tax=Pseudomonas sp. 5P_3.1_Bac2 TaxID=2971617 RepID=UPI0021CA02FC|nr:type I restriction-modification system endonuclease [Pseudomonas sp. 5P_3.1_Bac2]MCU1718175.1 type I restriction-modification system endonuclease [Pseudomonas sp. 5P_3.1_Bac2]
MAVSSNFAFLQEHDPLFLQLATTAEQVFAADPNTTLIKLRQLGEALAQSLASRAGIEFDSATTQADLLYKLSREIQLDPNIRNLFHTLRVEGNKATHGFRTQHREAMDGLKVARALAIWFHRTVGKNTHSFNPGPFVTPADPSASLRELQGQIEQLKAQLNESSQQLESNQQLADLLKREAEEYAVLAEQMYAESRTHKQLAAEHEAALNKLRSEHEQSIKALQQQLASQPQASQQIAKRAQQATNNFDLSEDLTRILIDQQLIEAGWEADSLDLTYNKGARPEKGKNKAIAEWPTSNPKACADYVLFVGLTPIAIVEAKRKRINIADRIPQAERYSREFKITSELQQPWRLTGQTQPWNDGQGGQFQVPFAFACNGRPYVKQLAELSGTWFRDLRSPANTRRALQDFHKPDDLLDLLKRSQADAETKLKTEGFTYLKLRDYQENAIRAVEHALANNQRDCLLAMATGTGKTRTIIGLMYRFLKTERFKRILFLVDRSALGQQAIDSFNDTTLEQNQTLAQIYDIKELGDMAAEAETRVQVATVQAMVSRIFRSDNPPAIGEFDCIIVDEAHRGYTLDQEMTEGELAVRDHSQYLSQYRRVLDHFDACRIGLTATPAKHTSEIFGKPVFTYSYREAVADDWLVDHEPPIRYETLLSQNGIRFEKGESVSVINTQTGEVDVTELEDELTFNIESFNRRVITPAFDKVICDELAKELDPFGEEKTMIFCVNQNHAERVKNLLDDAFKAAYGEQYNEAAVSVITGQSDKVEQLIRRYKNEPTPNIAITVDLLTTGIDVPRICNLVFMRRVRSRILYEQMKGRATRRCDDIGKTVFRIYDPVDLYASLEAVDTMKPLVKDPNISLEQLLDELTNDASHNAPGNQENSSHAHDVLDQLSQRVMRILRKAQHKAESKPSLKQKLNELQELWGVEPAKLHKHLHELGPQQAANFVRKHSQLLSQLDTVSALLGSENYPVISNHTDELKERRQDYGNNQKPADYLESFNDFIHNQLNQSAALGVVVNRPKDLTREQLREVRLLLDQHGFSEASLKSAWRNQTNQEIAASIIGYIRQAAIGEALLPFDQRVAQAMQKIYALLPWTPVQRKWLDRLAKQLVHEVIIDAEQFNDAFRDDGGLKGLNRNLGGNLDQVLAALNDSLWQNVS